MEITKISEKIVPVTELRRRFGELTKNLTTIESLILTRGGKPFAIIKAVPAAKKKVLKKFAGVWKKTFLDNSLFWKRIMKRKSRKERIFL